MNTRTTAAGLGCLLPEGEENSPRGGLRACVQGRLVTSHCPLLQEEGPAGWARWARGAQS